MMRVAHGVVAVVFLLVSHAADAQGLLHNPFARPAYLDRANATAPAGAGIRVDRLDLRATIADGENSLANVAGDFYRLGDEIDGYRLIAVELGRAVFAKGDQEMVVYVREQP